LIVFGGVAVVAAMLLILLYLFWTVAPLFAGASVQSEVQGRETARSAPARLFQVDERGELAVRAEADGRVTFFRVDGLESLGEEALALGEGTMLESVARDLDAPGLQAAGTDRGEVVLFKVRWERLPGSPGEPRPVRFSLEYPYGEAPRFFARAPLQALSMADRPDQLVIAALAGDELVVETATKQTDFLTGETQLMGSLARRVLSIDATDIAVDGNHRWVVVADSQGQLHRFDLPELEPAQDLVMGEAPVTVLTPLVGGVSLLVGEADGGLAQVFPVRTETGFRLQGIRRFPALNEPIAALLPEARRRGFVAIGEEGAFGIYHSTAGKRVYAGQLSGGLQAIDFPPRGDQLFQVDDSGQLLRHEIENAHPEVSFGTLWRKVWYENYPEPGTVWQSTAANDGFEPKLSLTPLAFGTLKASLYAMVFAIPIALLGATYTAVFIAPALRRKVKPAIELMAAMPTVILGFLAGLWLAPFIEQRLAGLFALFVLVPPGLLLFGYCWSRFGFGERWPRSRGWEPVLLIPVLIGLSALALWVAEPAQVLLFGGDLRDWLSQEAGITYDQRNAIVVGIAMGFSVIPIIFTIAEDALYAVPSSLSDGAMALGATRWQTLVNIVLPTASPGIFSGLMIGLGRAVGETMIVLMATGNTPIMGWSAFEGMRTMAANIAIEMPESTVGSTHFRVLMLSALVLFVFTFIVNTFAELIRQRLRARYAAL
ncbi:MAG: ABC transporter permease subunit, partial [Pseudomonadota bacterium]